MDGDSLHYELNIFGGILDTTIDNIADTTFKIINEEIWQGDTEYNWTVSVSDGKTSTASPDTFSFTSPPLVGINDESGPIPMVFSLKQNYPNPFNPRTTIDYDLPAATRITLKVYDILGREVVTLVNQRMPAGKHQVVFDASNFPSGLYLYRLETANYTKVRRMLLVK